MRTPASIARHPIHPMLITLPIGLWIFSFVCDLVVYFSDGSEAGVLWLMIGYWTMAGGLAGALIAAVPGLIDLLSLTDRNVRKIATTHMSINLVVVVLYGINLWLRSLDPPDFLTGMGLSVIGLILLVISGWLGGEMVDVHGVGVAGRVAPDTFVSDEAEHAESGATRLGHR